ncbi:hypothetical protein QYF36_015462 [Acer negundo]|nr:hypothetical protein QYF36_015462 [Acer negundo]
MQYLLKRQRESINSLIEEAIREAEGKSAKVLSLGLMNQGEELNKYGGFRVVCAEEARDENEGGGWDQFSSSSKCKQHTKRNNTSAA